MAGPWPSIQHLTSLAGLHMATLLVCHFEPTVLCPLIHPSVQAALIEYNLEAVDAALNAVREAVASGMDWRDLARMIKVGVG